MSFAFISKQFCFLLVHNNKNDAAKYCAVKTGKKPFKVFLKLFSFNKGA